MDKGLLGKYQARIEPAVRHGERNDSDEAEDLGYFGWMRGQGRCVMLQLRKKSGDSLAIGYGYIDSIGFDPSEGITISCGRRSIRIKGRCLQAATASGVCLLEGLVLHRVAWVREASGAEIMQAERGECLVESIEWQG
ncbi:MAG: hypothetical protein H6832_09345 [Planctomycetes bacterium]|nr:hypothetical protein [Planctomycetota bacterium]